MSNGLLDQYIEESRTLEEIASKIQQDDQVGQSQEEIKVFVEMYHNWYAECLATLPHDLVESFRVQYDKKANFFDIGHKIKSFLQEPTRSNPLYNPDKPVSGIAYWLYPYETAFRLRLLTQRQILLEAAKRRSEHVQSAKPVDCYVDPTRINELQGLNPSSFDVSKLIRLCEELNICYNNECYHATGMLLRTILDHVPPVFSCGTFAEVANNYSGSKSFKDAMKYLQESSRKISDSYLHTQIRKQEILPNKTQINFSANLDLLLSEIVRVLKTPLNK